MVFYVEIVLIKLVQVFYCVAQTILVLIIIFFLISFIWLDGIDFDSQSKALLFLQLLLIIIFFFCIKILQKASSYWSKKLIIIGLGP